MTHAPSPITPALPRPEVCDYLDAREYLAAVYAWRKTREPGFSYSAWADEMSIKSRAFLRLLVVGKRRITDQFVSVLSQGLDLKKSDAEYFALLVQYNQATQHQARERLAGSISALRVRKGVRTPVLDYYRFFASPLAPRLHALLTLDGTDRRPSALAKTLKTKKNEITEALRCLCDLGLAKPQYGQVGNEDEAPWRANTQFFEAPEQLGNGALQSFHRRSLEDSIKAIDLPVGTRRFQSALLCLTEEEFLELSQQTSDFLAARLHDFSERTQAPDAPLRLYQIHINTIPVSDPILRAEKSPRAPVGDRSPNPDRRENYAENEAL